MGIYGLLVVYGRLCVFIWVTMGIWLSMTVYQRKKRVSPRIMHIIRSETLGETLDETFRAKEYIGFNSRYFSGIGIKVIKSYI